MSTPNLLLSTVRVLRRERLAGICSRIAQRPAVERLQRWSRTSPVDLARGRRTLRVPGGRLEVPANLLWAYPGGRYYERNVEHWFRQGLLERRDPVVYDVGANCGYYTLLAAQRARRVYAFEPAAPTRELLERNVARNHLAQVEILPIALSDATGEADLTLFDSSGNNSLVDRAPESVAHLRVLGHQRVQLVALDDHLERAGLAAPDLIKMDIEGNELKAVRGARVTLREHRPMLLVEHDAAIAADAGYALEDLRAELEAVGYRVRGLRRDPYRAHEPDLALYEPAALPAEQLGTLVAQPRD